MSDESRRENISCKFRDAHGFEATKRELRQGEEEEAVVKWLRGRKWENDQMERQVSNR